MVEPTNWKISFYLKVFFAILWATKKQEASRKTPQADTMFPDLPLLLLAGCWMAGYMTGCSCMFLTSPATPCSRRGSTERDSPAALLPEPPAPDDGGDSYTMAQVR